MGLLKQQQLYIHVYKFMLSPEQRALYRSQLIAYYFNKQKNKDENTMAKIRRQIVNQDDKALTDNYNLIPDMPK